MAKLNKWGTVKYVGGDNTWKLGEVQPLPLDNIKVGQTVFLKQDIIEPCNDHSPGGRLGRWGDAVLVTRISIRVKDEPMGVDNKRGFCELIHCYYVHHFDMPGDVTFGVYRNEILPTDPLLTKDDQERYLSKSSYKTLEDRFKPREKKRGLITYCD